MATIYCVQHYSKCKDWDFDIFIESGVDNSVVQQRIKELQTSDTMNRTYYFLENDLTREEFYTD